MQMDPRFIKARDRFDACFAREARGRGITEPEISKLIRLLPTVIRNADCFQDTLTGLWRYYFGTPPISLQSGREVVGADLQYPQMRILVMVMHVADTYLPPHCFTRFIDRLAHRKKHAEVLAEFQPLMHRSDLTGIQNEVSGYAKKTIDWLIPETGKQPLLIEVKCRLVDLIESLESLEFAQSLGVKEIPAPRHDPAIMLRSTVDKFVERNPADAIQCVWVSSHLKQEMSETRNKFEQLAGKRIHVVIFGGWTSDVSMIGIAPEVTQEVARRLNVNLTDSYFFMRDTRGLSNT